ncbi:MAG: class I SAM-dependent methyltransferase [Deferribacteraceae bacterium]|jgi:23S rRNA (cytosine1962-C5)-methyltransferase|nr:class I SAM-dependent methyltransferase [Deferribacteraceae bacterium]
MNAPQLFISNDWQDYELLDAGDGNRLERWGKTILIRPDPQALWTKSNHPAWRTFDAIYHRSSSGGGEWEYKRKLPAEWLINYKDLTFKVHPTGFKHTGLFPEQAFNWDRVMNAVKAANRPIQLLNLFGYTGAASVAAAKAGAKVCHVDSAKGMLTWCRENAELSGVKENSIRLIPDDCLKFTEREYRRNSRYDAIIMDPPSFGRGAKGEVWKLEDSFWELLVACKAILSDNPLFMLINSYTAGISSIVAANMVASLGLPIKTIDYGELALPFRDGEMVLPCGLTVWAGFSK